MESSIAAVLAGLAGKSNDPHALQSLVDMFPSTAGLTSWSQMASNIATPGSPLMAMGKRFLPTLFGPAENTVTSGISRASNLPPGAITTVLTMAVPIVMGFITKKIREGGMTMSSLGALLQRESSTIRNALPSGVSEAFWPATATTASPVIAQTVHKEGSPNWIIPALVACALALGLIWLLGHARRPTISQTVPRPFGEASRLAIPPTKAVCTLPTNVVLPEGGVASRFMEFLQNRNGKVLANTWFTEDRLSFETGSAKLRPESQAQLNDLATVLTNCPNIRLTIAGYTDNVGNADSNIQLSRNRAGNVVGYLVGKGVSSDRLVTEGYGERDPVADNVTPEGRAQNRRVAILVTQN
jgi:outer membrane protein OmpA-like peptidoglycan-associated protein